MLCSPLLENLIYVGFGHAKKINMVPCCSLNSGFCHISSRASDLLLLLSAKTSSATMMLLFIMPMKVFPSGTCGNLWKIEPYYCTSAVQKCTVSPLLVTTYKCTSYIMIPISSWCIHHKKTSQLIIDTSPKVPAFIPIWSDIVYSKGLLRCHEI